MTEIKSKRAVEVIRYSFNVNSGIGISLRHAYEAVEGAEQDARERAVRAFCQMCAIPECPRDWKEGDYCNACQNAPAEFLKHYDNA